MNVEMMQRVRDQIAAHPEHFNLASYLRAPNQGNFPSIDHCKTTCCVAGTAVLLANGGRVVRDAVSWFDDGAKALGLDDREADRLFSANSGTVWYETADEFGAAKNYQTVIYWERITAEHCTAVLDRIISGEITL